MTLARRLDVACCQKGHGNNKKGRHLVAAKLGLYPGLVDDWCEGRLTPGPQALTLLARVLGLNPDWLLTGDNRMEIYQRWGKK